MHNVSKIICILSIIPTEHCNQPVLLSALIKSKNQLVKTGKLKQEKDKFVRAPIRPRLDKNKFYKMFLEKRVNCPDLSESPMPPLQQTLYQALGL